MSESECKKAPKRFGSVIKLKPEMYQRYKELHAAAWPKNGWLPGEEIRPNLTHFSFPRVLERIYKSNLRNYTIYYDKNTQVLFSHFEYIGDDFVADMAAIAADPITREWWKECEPCQESFDWTGPPPSEGGKGGNWWVPCEEMFHCGHYPTKYS